MKLLKILFAVGLIFFTPHATSVVVDFYVTGPSPITPFEKEVALNNLTVLVGTLFFGFIIAYRKFFSIKNK